eukprot:jgi/Chrpa1/25827/Chrysochromulina_OHIO_Genome00027360-RA
MSTGVDAPSFAGRHVSPTRTLGALQEAGFSVRRGLTTTTDFEAIPSTELALVIRDEAPDDDANLNGFSLEHCFDADHTESTDIICHNCRGLGHVGKHCPSLKKFRSFEYCITILTHAKQRAEERSVAKGGAPSGARPPPRGQRAPFQRQFPRRFQQSSQPHRRFVRASPRGSSDKARLAEEGEDDDNGDNGDGVDGRDDERIQSANILQREAPSMPTTFSSEHFETARVVTERVSVVDPIIDLANAYVQAPLLADETLTTMHPPGFREEIPVGTRVFGAYQPHRPTAAFLGVV